MAHLIVWSPRAINDLEEIAEYIAHDSDHYARSVVRTILQKSRKLSDFPYVGRIVPEFADESIREIFAYSYRIIYKVNEDKVNIATVVHGQRLMDISLKP